MPEPGRLGTRAHVADIAVLISGSIWGLFWMPLHHFARQGISGPWMNLLFFLITALVVAPVILAGGRWRTLTAGNLLTGLILGGAFAFYTLSLVATDVVRAILLFYVTPIWSTLIGVAFLGRRLTRARVVALVLGLTGLWLILGNVDGWPVPANLGDWLALGGGLLWALGTLRSYHGPSQPAATALMTFALGGLVIAGGALLLWPDLGGAPPAPALMGALPVILAVGIGMFVLPNVALLWAAQRIEAPRVGILLLSEVVTGTLSAALLAQEPFGARQMAGFLLILTAGATDVLAGAARPRPKPR